MSYPQQPPPNPYGQNQPPPPYGQPPQDAPPPVGGVPPYQQAPYGQNPYAPQQQPYGQPGYGMPPAQQSFNPLAIAALVMCVIFSPAALVLGIIALNQIKASGGRQKGNWMAWIGIVWGAVGILVILFVLVAGGLSGSTSP